MRKKKSIWLLGVLIFIVNPVIASQTATLNHNIKLIDQFYNEKNKNFTNGKLVLTATEVIKNRKKHTINTLAKAYVLLADSAMDKGDSARAFQFSQDGLTLGVIKLPIKLNLLLKITQGYYIQGKYKEVIVTADTVIPLAKKEQNISTLLNSYAYQASAYALMGKYLDGYKKLQLIDQIVAEKPHFSNHINLLQTLALANQNLGDYQTSITLHLKLLKLQFALASQNGIERTYYNLASSYLKLKKYDDAYNAFWQVKLLAEKKSAPIILAYAELGIGETLLKQHKYSLAYNALIKSEKLFKGKNLTKSYFSNLIALAMAARHTDRSFFASQILKKAEVLAQTIQLTQDQVKIYKLLSTDYQRQGNEHKALLLLNKYLALKKQFKEEKSKAKQLPIAIKHSMDKSKELTLKFSENGALYTKFSQKNHSLRTIIVVLTFITIALLIALIILWLKHRNYLFYADYIEVEQPRNHLPSPIITKKNYQLNYKKARKFNYPITISLISVVNWQELSFLFSNKIMKEIANNIAIIINDNIDEFEQAGKINDGDYLLMFPHKFKSEVTTTVEHITAELNARIFANLGEFSVIIKVISQTPNAQDIDPFTFLSQLDDLMN